MLNWLNCNKPDWLVAAMFEVFPSRIFLSICVSVPQQGDVFHAAADRRVLLSGSSRCCHRPPNLDHQSPPAAGTNTWSQGGWMGLRSPTQTDLVWIQNRKLKIHLLDQRGSACSIVKNQGVVEDFYTVKDLVVSVLVRWVSPQLILQSVFRVWVCWWLISSSDRRNELKSLSRFFRRLWNPAKRKNERRWSATSRAKREERWESLF